MIKPFVYLFHGHTQTWAHQSCSSLTLHFCWTFCSPFTWDCSLWLGIHSMCMHDRNLQKYLPKSLHFSLTGRFLNGIWHNLECVHGAGSNNSSLISLSAAFLTPSSSSLLALAMLLPSPLVARVTARVSLMQCSLLAPRHSSPGFRAEFSLFLTQGGLQAALLPAQAALLPSEQTWLSSCWWEKGSAVPAGWDQQPLSQVSPVQVTLHYYCLFFLLSFFTLIFLELEPSPFSLS